MPKTKLHISSLLLCGLIAGVLQLSGCTAPTQPQRPIGTPSAATAIPNTAEGQRIHLGRAIFNQTPKYAAAYTGAKLACADCHIQGGTEPYAAPMIDLAGMFPMFNKRAGRVITLQDRIEECFTRSENGMPLPYHGQQMLALTAYIEWLSRNGVKGTPYRGRGFVKIAELTGDATGGKQVYTAQCAGCHGIDGAGVPPVLPPLWVPTSFNDGADMSDIRKMAAFLQHNMPQNHPESMNARQAWDVAAYVHSKQRPKFNEAYKEY